jgi:hypothetical protein
MAAIIGFTYSCFVDLHGGDRTMDKRTLEDLCHELHRLILEHIESMQAETFLGFSKGSLCQDEVRLKRIRELYADLLAALKRNIP